MICLNNRKTWQVRSNTYNVQILSSDESLVRTQSSYMGKYASNN